MTYGLPHPVRVHDADAGFHVVAWSISILGVLAAAIGAWILLAPDNGTITIFGSTWAASDLVDTWGPWFLMVGGGTTAIGMTVTAVRDWQNNANRWAFAAEMLLAAAGSAAMITGFMTLL